MKIFRYVCISINHRAKIVLYFFFIEIVLCGASNSDLLMSFIVSDSRIVALFSAVYILEQEGLVFLDES